MTCCVAIEHDGVVHMAGDAALSSDNDVWVQSESKVFRRGSIVMAIAGAARWEPLLRYVVDMPTYKAGSDAGRWVNVDFAAAVRKAAIEEGYVNSGGWFDMGAVAAMVGVGGKLYALEPDLCGWRPLCGFHAIGSGQAHARVSLQETADRKLQPKTRLRRALERAAADTVFVRPPWSFESA